MSYEDNKVQLLEWLEPFVRYGVEPLRRLRFSELSPEGDITSGRGRVIFCTAAHTYSISFTHKYLGCVASARTARAGETWTRGNDLPDGKFSRETFDKIIQGVLAYEMVDLEPEHKPVLVKADVAS